MKFSFYAFLAIVFLLISAYLIIKTTSEKNICANSISCIKNLSGLYETKENQGVFLGKNVRVPEEVSDQLFVKNTVLGDTNLPKRIEIDLGRQHLYAYEGDKMVYDFLVSTGKWYPTPTGTFNIWVKLRYTRMSGGNPALGTYYNLPNVPYVMFFYNNEVIKSRGFSLHGTYWHNNFGHPMSHGCVNMRTEDVKIIYYWSNPPVNGNLTYANGNEGTKVVIYGQTPQE